MYKKMHIQTPQALFNLTDNKLYIAFTSYKCWSLANVKSSETFKSPLYQIVGSFLKQK